MTTTSYERNGERVTVATYEDTTTTGYQRDGEVTVVTTYEDTTTNEYERTGTKTTTKTYEDTKTTKKLYKVTKFHKNTPDRKLEFTIDATQNLFNVEAMPGLQLSGKAGIGAVINNLAETGYISLGLDAQGQLTPNLQMQLGAGERLRNGDLTSSLSAKVTQKVNENLKIFAGVNTSTLDAWSDLLSLDRTVGTAGAEYAFDKWTLETSGTLGNNLEGLSVLFKKNQNYFIEGLKQAV